MIREDFGASSKYDNLAEVLFGNLIRAADLIERALENYLARVDVTLAQYNVLRSIRERGKEGANIGVIANEMLNRQPDMTRLIDRMEAKGLVIRHEVAGDRRQSLVKLTKKGLKIADSQEHRLVKFHAENFSVLTREEQKHLKSLLFRIRLRMIERENTNESKEDRKPIGNMRHRARRMQNKGE